MSSSQAPRISEPGPFRASQLSSGDPYELQDGHAIRCMPSADRHGFGNTQGAQVLNTDPASQGAGTDVGFSFNNDQNLRAPDISLGNVTGQAGWAQTAPVLAVEYADRGQDETQLRDKIDELFSQGTQLIWVVRLAGLLHVEVHRPGQKMVRVDAEGTLTAPGILQNPVPVRALVEREAANEVTLRNLLNRKGYESLDAVLLQGERTAVYDACEILNIELTPPRRALLEGLDLEGLRALRTQIKRLRAWPS